MADHVLEKNDIIDKIELRKAISHVKSEDEEEHERNIENMVQDDNYKPPWKIICDWLFSRCRLFIHRILLDH